MSTVLSLEAALALIAREAATLDWPDVRLRTRLDKAHGCILAETITTPRDLPPFPRSTRDGFAVRAADLPNSLTVVGTVLAGQNWTGPALQPHQAIAIMTGAPVPAGADAVLMVEHATRSANTLTPQRTLPAHVETNPRLGTWISVADGAVEVHVGTHSHGQGHETTYAQVAHEILGVDFDKIKIVQGDTLYTPYSTSTWGSRCMVHGGGAVARACQQLAKRAAQIGAWLLQTDVANVRLADGKIIAGASSVTLREVARAWYLQPQNLPANVDTGGLEVTAGYRAERDSGTFTYATHAAVVMVDPATGVIELKDYVVVEDGGVLVNPMIVDGQICGGTAQGIGTCLYEAMPFDINGQPLASTMLDYMLPGATEVPDIRVLHMETPSPYTEFGIKGLGEGGAVGPPAAIVSAVNDALRPLGVEVYDLPLTPERILSAIESANKDSVAGAAL